MGATRGTGPEAAAASGSGLCRPAAAQAPPAACPPPTDMARPPPRLTRAHSRAPSSPPLCSYQNYLEGVLAAADEYQEVGELLSRHATLQATNKDLRRHMAEHGEAAEAVRGELAAFVKARTDDLLQLNNRLAQLKQEREAYKQDARLQEAAKDAVLEVASQHTLTYGQIVLAADNLYAQCKSRSCIAQTSQATTMQQLDVIANFVSDLEAICKQRDAPAAAATPAAPA
jgi:paraquat-inducible protein B